MKTTLLFLIAALILLPEVKSQKSVIYGKVNDGNTRKGLFNVSIVTDKKEYTISDTDGNYKIEVESGPVYLNFYYIGYKDIKKQLSVKSGEKLELNVALEEEVNVIDEVVVSAGKFQQKLSDVTVSMEVMKPAQIDKLNITRMDDAINYIPGVEIIDTQPSIRGGSGYSFGAGSRVMLLVDDMPLISPDAGDIKWNFLSTENLSQIEVIKGASSSLFGSSALNGVINIRTAYPKDKPETRIRLYSGIYMNPDRKDLIWWGDRQPLYSGINFCHGRKIGNLDVVVGGNLLNNQGYREGEYEERARINANLRYKDKKIRGLFYGINSNFLYHDKSDFFMWRNDSSGAWMQPSGSLAPVEGRRANIDPYIEYFTKNGDKHSLKTRYFYTDNMFRTDTAKDSRGDLFYSDYQYQKKFANNLHITSGVSATYSDIRARLYGNHYSSNFAIYTQADKKYGKLSVSIGARAEYMSIDTTETVSKLDMIVSKDTLNLPVIPVFRSGVNYQIAEYTFLRASFGQGFRFPSIAEKYTSASISALRVFPNPRLKMERGWSAELAGKQGLEFMEWRGYLDVAFFWTEYRDMMEYAFGAFDTANYYPIIVTDTGLVNSGTGEMVTFISLDNMGFQSQNVGHSRITGVDIVLTGTGKILGLPAKLMLGYVYTNPIDLTVDANDTTRSTSSNILKYRYYHTFKGDMEINYKKFSFGVSYVYHSYMINVDEIFENGLSGIYILPGYKEYREKHNKGAGILDARLSYGLTDYSRLSLVVKNVFNIEYMTRPGDIRPPRSAAIQYTLDF